MKDRTKKNDINNNIYIYNNLENKANNQNRKQHFSKIKYKNSFNKFFCEFIKLIFLLEISSFQLTKLNKINSEIIIVINTGGKQYILSKQYNDLPDYIFENEKQVSKSKTLNLDNGTNIIKMIWNHTVIDCSYMFYKLNNIIEVDLSNFDSSNVITMESMFNLCTNIEKINLKNVNTSLVTNMKGLFSSCKNIISLDLSSFNTSSVESMQSMFYGCNNLISLDFITLILRLLNQWIICLIYAIN